jgi:hypothetical protein
VGLSIETDSPNVYNFYLAEYAFHLTKEQPINIPKVILRFTESKNISAPKGFVFHKHKLLAKWAYKLVISKNHIEIDVIGNKMSISMVHHMLVHSAIRVLVSFGDTLLLHAGSTVKDDHSFIFTGHGGAGKTTITSLLLANGVEWSLHADDYVFLSPRPDPKSMAYLTRAHLYRDLLMWVPSIRSRITFSEKMRLELFSLIRSWSGDVLKWPTRLDLKRLWPNNSYAFHASPAGLFILERTNIVHPQLIQLNFEENFLNSLIDMNFFEARHFITLLYKSNVIPDCEKWLFDWKLREKQLLSEFMHKSQFYKLSLPKQFAAQDFNVSVPELMNSLLTLS